MIPFNYFFNFNDTIICTFTVFVIIDQVFPTFIIRFIVGPLTHYLLQFFLSISVIDIISTGIGQFCQILVGYIVYNVAHIIIDNLLDETVVVFTRYTEYGFCNQMSKCLIIVGIFSMLSILF